MSYSPEPGRDPRPAPWASPSTPDPQDTQRFEDAPPAGGTRVDQAVDVSPEREDVPADRTQPVSAHVGSRAADHGRSYPGDHTPGYPTGQPGGYGRYPADQPGGQSTGYPADQPAGHPADQPAGPTATQPQPA